MISFHFDSQESLGFPRHPDLVSVLSLTFSVHFKLSNECLWSLDLNKVKC